MTIVGDHPEAGIRFDLERRTTSAPWSYVGSAFLRDHEHPLQATIDAAGVVVVAGEAALPKDVVQRCTLLLRTAWKRAGEDGALLVMPRRIHRWRAG